MWPRPTSNLKSSCLSFPVIEITTVYHQGQIRHPFLLLENKPGEGKGLSTLILEASVTFCIF